MNEPFIDCTVPITNIKPKRGFVLVELLAPPTQIGSVLIPAEVAFRAGAGGSIVREMEKFPAQEALVRKLGEPEENKPFEVGLGDRVMIRYYAGTNMRQPPRRYKLVKGTDIEAVFV